MSWPLGAALAIPVMAGSVPATATAAEAATSTSVETFAYPDAAKILAERNITLKTGDGNIALADCASGPGLVQLFSRAAKPSSVCFRITGPTGYLALEIPKIYLIKGDDHTIKATVNTDGNAATFDVVKNAWASIGEGGSAGSATALLELAATDGSAAPAPSGDYPAVGKVTVGQPGHSADARACTAALVDRYWVLTAAGCFNGASGTPAVKSTATVNGRTVDIAELVPRSDRDLVMARLTAPVDGVAPVALATAAPSAGDSLKVPGYGRTATDWAPFKVHTTTHTAGAIAATTVDTAPAAGAAAICQGDAGAPLLRDRNGSAEIAAVASLSWQGGCLGTPATETRTGATATRVDDLGAWVQQVKAARPGSRLFAVGSDSKIWTNEGSYSTNAWGTFDAVPGTNNVKQVSAVTVNGTIRLFALGGDNQIWTADKKPDGSWTTFTALPSSGIQNITATTTPTGVRLFAVGSDNRIWTTDTRPDGTWSTFDAVPGANNVKQVSAVTVGDTIRLFALGGDNQIWTADKKPDGSWTTFTALPSSGIQNITATTTPTGVRLFAVGSDNRIWTTDTRPDGTWSTFDAVPGANNVKQVSAVTVGDTIRLFALGGDNQIWTADKKPDGSWTTFYAVPSSNIQNIAAAIVG
ncbi:trypsin-like serine protease [Kitasatospora sp. NPDC093558]|uniref:trypsin-like serine protease n=1 Tax=Kitasatospora sp. NPDC093558 TaxID=3155201 RepID=UPI00341B816B